MKELNLIKGLGPKTISLLNKLNIFNIDDLLTYYPSRYDFLVRSDLSTAQEDDKVIIDGKVESVPLILRFNKGLNKMNFRLSTTQGVIGVSIFNRAFMKTQLGIGTNVVVIGKFDRAKNVLTASELRFDTLSKDMKIEPVYHLTSGLTSKNLSTFINLAMLVYGREVEDNIPVYLQDKYEFVNKKTSLNLIHNPSDVERLRKVQERLKYEELFEFMTKINYLKELNKKEDGIKRNIDMNEVDKFIETLPFKLTNDQIKVIKEIIKDLNSGKVMNRLLQGDVGSGKTIVSLVAIYFNKLSGYQSALMAPTEILATQHYNNIIKIFKDKLNVKLLIGSTSKKEKEEIYKELESGKIDLVIGTHALIQEGVKYNNLGLVVTDEQHRFGVNQRALLKNKGVCPDVLYMSATPIPRTFALTIYGDMDVSTIKEMPKGRIPIKTYLKSNEEIKDVLQMMLEELQKHHQIYVISPMIEDSENNSDLTSVNNLKDNLELAFGSKYNIDVLHGKISSQIKDKKMNDFKDGKIDILISTTVVEVGVDNPNASMIVIFDANRFGLSTLHQLRGRVGRGSIESSCILIGEEDNERLNVLLKTNDGFEIAEEDFKLRGSGDLFGTKQSGELSFKIASIKEDYDILVKANEDSKEFLLRTDVESKELLQRILDKSVID